jgi:branched-chain amino acid transport system ATP-binding protein
MLRVSGLTAGYHGGTVLHGVDFTIESGTVQAIVGRNGAGKTTLVHAVAGLLRPYRGMVEVYGENVAGKPAYRVARAGVGLVPQGRRVFASLTVAEHLSLAVRSGPWTIPRVLDLLPRLDERRRHRGDQLSGGEQQMLAIARALMSRPRLLLLDEPSLGLAPLVARQIFDAIRRLNEQEKLTVFLVEQNAFHALKLAHRGYVMVNGRITLSGSGRELLDMPEVKTAYLEGGRH